MISQSGRGGYKGGRCNYWRRLVSHMISTAAETTKWYSSSIEERVKKHKHICMEVSEIIVIACPLSIRVSYQCQGLWTTKKQNMVKCVPRYRIIRCFAAVQLSSEFDLEITCIELICSRHVQHLVVRDKDIACYQSNYITERHQPVESIDESESSRAT
jgi:hypothetical protein